MLIALRLAWRDWRGGDMTMLLGATTLSVAIVTAISLFTERLGTAILVQGSELLGADLVVSSPRPLPPELLGLAEPHTLRRTHSVSFATMAASEERFQITSVKAVDGEYPLRGRVVLAPLDGTGSPPGDAPQRLQPGMVWAEQRLLDALELQVGDPLMIGDVSLRIERVVVTEPGAANAAMMLGPRLLMHVADLPATGVVQPGSRVRHRYYFAGHAADIAAWREQLEPHLLPEHRVTSTTEGRPGLNRAVERAQSYLMLGAALGVTLAGGAIAIAARRYSVRHTPQVAVLKTLGLSGARIAALYGGRLLALALTATMLGWSLGWLLMLAIYSLMGTLLGTHLQPASMHPYLLGAATAIASLFAFALPPLLALRRVSALAALRQDLARLPPGSMLSVLLGVPGLLVLLIWYTGDLTLSLVVTGGLLLILASVSLVALWLIRVTGLVRFQAGNSWLLATSSLRRRGVENAMQVAVFALTLMLILVLVVMRTSVLGQWQRELPADAPNHFLINIAPAEEATLLAWLAEHRLGHAELYPVVRARLTRIDGVELREGAGGDSEAPTRLDRELSVTSRAELPADNTLVQGRWWSRAEPSAEVSVEQSLAESLGIQLGSELDFQVGSEVFQVRVSSIRGVTWENMKPNFYMIMHPSVLVPFPRTSMTSFYLPDAGNHLLGSLLRQFPTVTAIDIGAIIAQIQAIVSQVSVAVEAILWLLLGAGLLVLMATIQAGLPERSRQGSVLRTLGASKRLLWGSITIEFLLLGLLSGLLAAAGAEAMTAVLQRELFHSEWRLHGWLWWLGPILGGLVITSMGAFASRSVVSTPPVVALRAL